MIAALSVLWVAAACSSSDGGPTTTSPSAPGGPSVSVTSTPPLSGGAVPSPLADIAEAAQFSSTFLDAADTDQVQIRVTPHVFRKGDPDFHYDGADTCPGAELSDTAGVLVVDITARTDTYDQGRALVLIFAADQETVGTTAPTAPWRAAMVRQGSRGLSAAVQPGPGLTLGGCTAEDDRVAVTLPLRIDPTAASTRFRTFVVVEDWFDHATDQTLPPGMTLGVGLEILDDTGQDVVVLHLPEHRNALDTGESVPCPAVGTC